MKTQKMLCLAICFSSLVFYGVSFSAEPAPSMGKLKAKQAANTKSKSSGQCMAEIAKETFKVVKQIDKMHYWLLNESNQTSSGHVEMETQRALPIGESVTFQEATFLGTNGNFSNLIVLWREGCSEKDKAAADYTQGTWWAQIDPTNPTGAPCVKAVTAKYNIAPVTMIKASEGACVVSDGSSPFGMLDLDCTRSAFGAKLLYFRSRKSCLEFVSMANAYNKSKQETNE